MEAIGGGGIAPHPQLKGFTSVGADERLRRFDTACDECAELGKLRERLVRDRAAPKLLEQLDATVRETVASLNVMRDADEFIGVYADVKRLIAEPTTVDASAIERIGAEIHPICERAKQAITPERPLMSEHAARLLAFAGLIGVRRIPLTERKTLGDYRMTGCTALGQRRYETTVSPGAAAWYARDHEKIRETYDLLVGVDARRSNVERAGRDFVEVIDTPHADRKLVDFLNVAVAADNHCFRKIATTKKIIGDYEAERAERGVAPKRAKEIDRLLETLRQVRDKLFFTIGDVELERHIRTLDSRASQAARPVVQRFAAQAYGLENEGAVERPARVASAGTTPLASAAQRDNASPPARAPEPKPATPTERAVAGLLASSRPSQRLEGKIASRILDIDLFRSLEVNTVLRRGDRTMTEFDVETPRVIFEVTGARSGKLRQMRRRTTRDYNPLLKDQVLVAPEDFDAKEKAKIGLLRPTDRKESMLTLVTTEAGLEDVCFTLARHHQSRYGGMA